MSGIPERRRPVRLTLAIFVVVFVTMAAGSSWDKSGTWDEAGHLAFGYAALSRGDYRLDPEHPPLLRLWAALPLLAMPGITLDMSFVDRTEPSLYLRTVSAVPKKFVYFDNDGDRLLRSGRVMMTLLGAALGVLVFAWAYEWLGWWPAVIALTFFALEPNLLSHSALVTTDIGLTAFAFAAMYFLWRACRHRLRRDLAVAALAVAGAAAAKFSVLIFAPAIAGALVLYACRCEKRRVITAIGLIIGFGLTAWVVIWASYGFRYMPSHSNSWRYHFHEDADVRTAAPGLAAVTDWVDGHRLLPNAFTEGFLFTRFKTGDRPAFLAGAYSTHGWWYYFPVALMIKTPLSLLALVGVGMVTIARRWRSLGVTTLAFVCVPAAIYFMAAVAAAINIGLRHILPVYPFLMLIAAVGARAIIDRLAGRGRLVLGALTMAAALELATVYPSTLTFFNQAVGGPSHGEQFLVDSNLDWGQDLKPLKRWMDEQGVPQINLAYFGTADPAYYHIDRIDLPGSDAFIPGTGPAPRFPGYFAVSATILNGVYFTEQQRHFYEPLRSIVPVTTIGNSIHVYWVDRPWW